MSNTKTVYLLFRVENCPQRFRTIFGCFKSEQAARAHLDEIMGNPPPGYFLNEFFVEPFDVGVPCYAPI